MKIPIILENKFENVAFMINEDVHEIDAESINFAATRQFESD